MVAFFVLPAHPVIAEDMQGDYKGALVECREKLFPI